MQETNMQLDAMNLMFLKYFEVEEAVTKDIMERKATDHSSPNSQYSSFFDYLHLHFVEKSKKIRKRNQSLFLSN